MTTRVDAKGAALVSIANTAPPVAGKPGRDSARARIPGEAGIWIFIFGDMTLYAALFASFMIDRSKEVELYNRCAATLHTEIGVINALLLLTSSLCVALSVKALREQVVPKSASWLIAGAFTCGLGFVAFKYIEYSDLLHRGFTPVENSFYTYYYVLTGIHLTHLLAGMCVLLYMYSVARKDPHLVNGPVGMENAASFWHAVDLLWLVLFPLLYLVR